MTSHTLRSFACTSGSASRSASLRTVYRPAHHNTTVMSGRQVDDCAHDFATGMQLSASARPQLPHDKRRTTQCGERSRHGGEGLVKVQSSSPQSAARCAPDLICCKIRPNQIRLRSASHVCRSGERAQHQSQRLVALPPLPPTPPRRVGSAASVARAHRFEAPIYASRTYSPYQAFTLRALNVHFKKVKMKSLSNQLYARSKQWPTLQWPTLQYFFP